MSRAQRFPELAELLRKGISEHPATRGALARAARRHPAPGAPTCPSARSACTSRRSRSMGEGPMRARGYWSWPRTRPMRAARSMPSRATIASSANGTRFVALTPARVRHAASDAQRARILAESARALEEELAQPAEALAALCEAFVLDPMHSALESELMRLGELTRRFDEVERAYGRAATAAVQHNDLAVRLQYVRARLLETRLGDQKQALSVYLAAFDWLTEDRWGDRPIDPSPRMLLHAIARCAAALGAWAQATDAVVQACAMLGAEESELLGRLEAETSSRDAWSAMCERFALALDRHRERLLVDLCYRLEIRLALWYRHRVGDLASAEAMALRALAKEQSRSAGTMLLCDIQRHTESPALGRDAAAAGRARRGRSPDPGQPQSRPAVRSRRADARARSRARRRDLDAAVSRVRPALEPRRFRPEASAAPRLAPASPSNSWSSSTSSRGASNARCSCCWMRPSSR